MRALCWSVAALCAALGGCAVPGYDHTDLEPVGVPPPGVQLAGGVVVPEGMVVEVAATALSADSQLGGDFTFDLVSADPSVLGVEAALGQEPGQALFVFFGASVGSTRIEVFVDDQQRTPIPAMVTPEAP